MPLAFFQLNKPAKELFSQWLEVYPQHFKNAAERQAKFLVFQKNLLEIKKLNGRHQGWSHYDLGPHMLMTKDEFNKRNNHVLPSNWRSQMTPAPPLKNKRSLLSLPASVDWRKRGKVNHIKDQGYCGSCWTFSTAGTMESSYAVQKGHLYSFSEQEIVDCVTGANYKIDQACNGGWTGDAFNFIDGGHRFHTESSYPYHTSYYLSSRKSYSRFPCRKFGNGNTALPSFTVNSLAANANAMMAWVAEHGPVSVLVDAKSWQHYRGGVIGPGCGTALDHAVIVVGYGSVRGRPVWIVRNSWGTGWGMEGYAYVSRGGQDCGIMKATIGILFD